jgi:hypothetical protein
MLDDNSLMTSDQQKLVLNYAESKKNEEGQLVIPPVSDKLSFLKATQCDRMRKPLGSSNQSQSEERPAKRARIESSCSRSI